MTGCRECGRREILLGMTGMVLAACSSRTTAPHAGIRFTRVPRADRGSGSENDVIEGVVTGARTDQQIVLYAKAKTWWLQPSESAPFTKIRPDSGWTNATQLGTEYAALLVEPGFVPPEELQELPVARGSIQAVATIKGALSAPSPSVSFCGYDWRVRTAPSDRGGSRNLYQAANVWIDTAGAMHLHMAKAEGGWSCAEVALTRNLGFGTYRFLVRDTAQLELSAVFVIFTYDYSRAKENFGEVNIEISRWGDPANKNAEYIIQPFNVPTNVFRFSTPPGRMTYSLNWQDERMEFRSARPSGEMIADHEFRSGIPRPGLESVRMALYRYNGGVKIKNPNEVVIEKFEYLP